jgi:hypothetical protein
MVYALHFGAISAISQVHQTLSRRRARSRSHSMKALAASLQDTLVISSPIPIPYVGYLTVLPSVLPNDPVEGDLKGISA